MNDYFNTNGNPADGQRGLASVVRAIFTLISQGMDKVPPLLSIWTGAANYAADAGVVNAYAITVSQYVTALAAGRTFRVKVANTNTGASTLAVTPSGGASFGAIAIKRADGSALQASDMVAGQIASLVYDGTVFQLEASGAAASATAAAASASAASGSASAASTSASNASTSASNAATSASNASTSATNAANSAIAASNYAAALQGTSTTSLLIGTGSKSFTASTGKQWSAGQFITASSAATPANYMHGQVTSYNSGTGALVVNVTDVGGSGTLADWNLTVAGSQGTPGATGSAPDFLLFSFGLK